jgi:hypothetical protein
MKEQKLKLEKEEKEEPANLEGYPVYEPEEDVYKQFSKKKYPNSEVNTYSGANKELPIDKIISNQENSSENMGQDLDVPGSELDDKQESVGSEDEENNFYSLGDDTSEMWQE